MTKENAKMSHHNENLTKKANSESIFCKIEENIDALLRSAKNLQDALIHRRVDEIWKILAEKQEKSSQLEQYTQLWSELFSDVRNSESPAVVLMKEEIRTSLSELRLIEHNNASLSQSFLGAIRKALFETGTGLASKKKTYNKYGRMGIKRSSLLVNKLG